MTALVGYTGFVGSNIYATGQIDVAYNSKNIEEAYGTNPNLLIYAGLRAEKYLANNNPAKDLLAINRAIDNIIQINPKKLVLISTIDVFKNPIDVDEDSVIDTDGLQTYGYNRHLLELWARDNYPNALIIRLPGLYGANIKKNFIYDFINVIPFMLKTDKFNELCMKDNRLRQYYDVQDNGFYKTNVNSDERTILKKMFEGLDFSALNFTDSRSVFQFYNLNRLWGDIQIALDNELRIWHPATEPVSAGEVYEYLTGKKWQNELNACPVEYNYKTLYAQLFGGEDVYICKKEEVLDDIKTFVEHMI